MTEPNKQVTKDFFERCISSYPKDNLHFLDLYGNDFLDNHSALVISLFHTLAEESAVLASVDQMQRSERTHPLVHVCFADSRKCQARSMVFEGENVIYLYTGLVLSLYSLFCRMLAHPEVLPHIGDPSLENAEGPHNWECPERFLDYQYILTARQDAGAANAEDIVPPQCPYRRAYARRLMLCAFHCLLFHEYAHLRFGHVRLQRHLHGMNFMEDGPEFSGMAWGPEDGFTAMANQALEYDADTYGALWSLRLNILLSNFWAQQYADGTADENNRLRFYIQRALRLTRQVNLVVTSSDPENLEHVSVRRTFTPNTDLGLLEDSVTDLDDAISGWAFAVATTFKFMGLDSDDTDNLTSYGYPPVALRLRIGAEIGQRALELNVAGAGLMASSHLYSRISEGFDNAAKAFTIITGQEDDFPKHINKVFTTPAFNEHLDRLEVEWRDIVPSLRPFAWAPLTNDPEANASKPKQTKSARSRSAQQHRRLIRGQSKSRRR